MSEYQYKAGTILLLEEGEYSDYGYCAQLVTLVGLDLRQAVNDFKAQNEPSDERCGHDTASFVGWLCSTQQCAQLECQTAHIGSCGQLEI